MKKILRISVLVALVIFNTACGGGFVSVKIKVVDDTNVPIEDAQVAIYFSLSEGSNSYRGNTNRKGEASATRLGAYGTLYRITKEGYYDSAGEFSFGDQDATIVLRRKAEPIPMYSKKTELRDYENKFSGVWVGYDFGVGDYLTPYGAGVNGDFEFKYIYDEIDIGNYRLDLVIRFPNNGDGLIPFMVKGYKSDFKSDYLAPEGGYRNESKYYEYKSSNGPFESNFDRFRNYYFRVRTKIDKDGNVVSALYGKLYSEFPKLHYYLNPNDNDRNVEFDPRQNLFVNLPKEERQFEP